MKKLTIIASGVVLLSSGAALAHSHKTGAHAEHKCEIMKDGKKMHGTMQKGADGKMTCKMADHSKMDHSKMDHSKMDHSKMDHGKTKPE